MVTWGSALEKHCKSIESVILVERQRLKSAQDQLKQYGSNPYFEQEREESKRRYEQIRWCKKQVHFLRNEHDVLRKAIIEAENKRLDDGVIAHKKRSMKIVAAEIESCKMEIDKLDKLLRQIREVNSSFEKDQQKRLRDFSANHGFIIKPRSSGCLQLGRLMMEEEDAKQALNSAIAKRTKLQHMIRELEKSLIMVERQCNLQEKNIRIKESEEIGRNITLIDDAYKRRKKLNDELEYCLAEARAKLASIKTFDQRNQPSDTELLLMQIENDKKRAESYRANVAQLNLVASSLYNEVLEATRKATKYSDNFMKDYEESMRKVNMGICKMKSENAALDAKIENIRKVNDWTKKGYEQKVLEQEEHDPTDEERLMRRFRVEEDEAKQKLQIAKESSKKVKEQIEHMLDILFNEQLQCFMKERIIEEISNGLREVKIVNDMVLREKRSDKQ